MRLGVNIGYMVGQPQPHLAETIIEAERLGYDALWTAEAYGSDALTPLAWFGAGTTSLRLGTGIMQLSARTPAAAAMAAMTMDQLSAGRFILGLGVSGPQVVEGWYGQPFANPLARTREYIAIIRAILARERPVEFAGEHYQVPYPGGTGLGKPLKSMLHPRRKDPPIFLAAEGPKNIALAAEIADGWLPLFFSPRHEHLYTAALNEGFARPGARRSREAFEVQAAVMVAIDSDVERAADMVRPALALYIGGMGAREVNFHAQVAARMGYEAEAAKIQDLYLEGRKQEAAAAVPQQLVEDVALVGPIDKIREDLQAWRSSIVTTLLVPGSAPLMRAMTELVS